VTPRASLTATPTATEALPACVGDCDGNRRVVVNELVIGVNISLERQSIEECEVFDPSGNRRVEVNELVQGVNNSLGGCPGS
jgi:hypothetical protein